MALHEVMHSLGFHHEHQRYDRDQYIKVLYTEAEPWYMDNLARFPPNITTYYGTPYDYMSIMHYPLYMVRIQLRHTKKSTAALWFFFQKWFELVPRMGGEGAESEIGFLKGLSNSDVDALNRAYCPGKKNSAYTLTGYVMASKMRHKLYLQPVKNHCHLSSNPF